MGLKEWWSLWIGEKSLPHSPQRLCKGDEPGIPLQMWGPDSQAGVEAWRWKCPQNIQG